MSNSLSTSDFLYKALSLPVVDVRSPGEYEQGHIPGAVNIPLFTNDERALVGTTYKQVSKPDALLVGLDIVGPKMASFVRQAQALTTGEEILVHCWRGGMRSGSFGWLLETAGMKVSILEGGYKAFRTQALEGLWEPRNLVVLGGKTGSGKTQILHELRALGEQVLDLEHLAHHKGSSYGAIGQLAQPSSEHFENKIYSQWREFDPSRRVWVEDESRSVGRCQVPDGLWVQMKNADLILVDLDKTQRIERLVREYACFDRELLFDATHRIAKRLGGQHHKAAITALEEGDFAKVAEITLTYYDKAYLHGIEKRPAAYTYKPTSDTPTTTAYTLLDWANKNRVGALSKD